MCSSTKYTLFIRKKILIYNNSFFDKHLIISNIH